MVPTSQQALRPIEPRLDAELVRRVAKQRVELANEMKRRHRGFPRHLVDGQRTIVYFAQHLARAAQACEDIVGEHGVFHATADRS
jgi:hypothetical protein